MLRTLIVALSLSTLTATPAAAQRSRCGTLEPDLQDAAAAPLGTGASDCGYFTNVPRPEYEPSCYYDIPVVFHVIRNTSGEGDLSAATIQDQIDILNEDFQALPGSPGAPGTDGRIRFHLATTDPAGNPTSGITYSTNDSWYVDSGNYWSSLAWDTNRYLNIYTNAVPCCYGYVPGFPSEGIAGQANDRVVLWWEAVGRLPTAGWPLNMGRTATHEVGHYLGLYHTFCGGCGSAVACYSTGDLICDTNGEANPTSGCPALKSSCGNADPIHNYMDYSDDPCLWEFTPEQVNRMRCTLAYWRPGLFVPDAPVGQGYCQSTANSSGSAASLAAAGSASLSRNALTLRSTGGASGTAGLFYYGATQIQTPFGDGFRCVGGMTLRVNPPVFADGTGTAERLLDLTQPPLASGPGAASPGTTWNFQYWFRDPMGPGGTGFNLTDGRSVTFCP